VYGYNATAAKDLAANATAATNTSLTTTLLNQTPITTTYESAWSTGPKIRWAEEQQGDARILRVRTITPASADVQANAIVAGLITQWPAYLDAHPEVARLVINKGTLANTPGLSAMLADSGWKETKEYWVIGREKVGGLQMALQDDKAAWQAASAIPTSVPAGGYTPLSGAPTVLTPSFVYGFDKAQQQAMIASLVDTNLGTVELAAGKTGTAGEAHSTVIGKATVEWSISPSGKTVSLNGVTFAPGSTMSEQVNSMFAAMQHLSSEAGNRAADGKLMVKPDVYHSAPGIESILADLGAKEETTVNLGEMIQMPNTVAKSLADSLAGDTMGSLKISAKTSHEYLGYNEGVATKLFEAEPLNKGKGVMEWKTGLEGNAAKPTTTIAVSADGHTGEIVTMQADPSVATVALIAQLNWLVENGAGTVLIRNEVLAQANKVDKFLLALGGTVETGGIRLTDKALLDARAYLTKDTLPVIFGGKALPFTVVDTMIGNIKDIVVAAHTQTIATIKGATASTMLVGGREVKMAFTRSPSNIFWESVERGGASVGQSRSASVAQLRAFLQDVGQNATLERLDISMAVIRDQPGLAMVLRKYGAKEVAASGDHPAFLTLERGKANKLRADLDKEIAEGTPGSANFIGQQAALINWPVAEDLKEVHVSLGGQTSKNVFEDAQGNRWLFKPGASGRGSVTDQATATLAEMLGLPVPPVRIYTLNVSGKPVAGSLQKMLPSVKEIRSVSEMTPKQVEELWQHEVLDRLVANDDSHIQNFLVDADGHMWAIDKSRAWESLGGSKEALDINNLGQGGSDAMQPLFLKFWKQARQNPDLLKMVHPQTMAKPLRAVRAMDDAEYRRIVAAVAPLTRNSRYAGNPEKMVADMIARKNSVATDLEDFISGQIKTMQREGKTVPKEWADWVKNGGRFNLDATPKDLQAERMAVLDQKYGADPSKISQILGKAQFERLRDLMSSGFGSGSGLSHSAAGQITTGAGHLSGGHKYGYEEIRPYVGKAVSDEWEDANEWAILHALLDADTSWMPQGSNWAKTLRDYYNPETGKIRIIRSTNGYGTAQKSYEGYSRDGFRNLFSTAIGSHVQVAGNKVWIYFDVEPRQCFTYYGFGYGLGGGEAEIALADPKIEQVVLMRNINNPIGGNPRGPLSAAAKKELMDYNGPVVG
jgi:hypothetical protein